MNCKPVHLMECTFVLGPMGRGFDSVEMQIQTSQYLSTNPSYPDPCHLEITMDLETSLHFIGLLPI